MLQSIHKYKNVSRSSVTKWCSFGVQTSSTATSYHLIANSKAHTLEFRFTNHNINVVKHFYHIRYTPRTQATEPTKEFDVDNQLRKLCHDTSNLQVNTTDFSYKKLD